MKLIKNLGLLPVGKKGQRATYGIYECPLCFVEITTISSKVKSGVIQRCKSCGNKSLVHGVGINDTSNSGEGCPFYIKWTRMLQRCYSEKSFKKHPTYKEVSVCDEWLLFSNFKDWMMTQDWENKELDKDIKYPNNKVYSPYTCCFVTPKLNRLIHPIKNNKGEHPTGVCYVKRDKKFMASISIDNKRQSLGHYDTAKEAEKAYLEAKIKEITKHIDMECDVEIKQGLKRHIQIMKNDT